MDEDPDAPPDRRGELAPRQIELLRHPARTRILFALSEVNGKAYLPHLTARWQAYEEQSLRELRHLRGFSHQQGRSDQDYSQAYLQERCGSSR